jgi:D-alanyl-D-alanine carboxypeptidase
MHARSDRRGALAGAAIVLIAGLLAIGTMSASADSGRRAALVVDANTGRVLHAKSADAARYPASLTKVMTLYLVFELMEAGKLDANTPIKISAQASAAPPSKLDLDPGDTIPLGAAIRALVTKSANDVAVAVAEHISGTQAAFARAMTAKARQLGMRSTVFRNAHGLPDSEQVTTARDMVTLSLAIYDHFPNHAKVFSTRRFTYAGASYRNHNTLLATFSGMDGIKTGYTRSSGFNLTASVRRDGRHVVAAVLGGRSAAARNAEMRTLLTRGLARASTRKSRRPVLLSRAEPAPPVAARTTTAAARTPRAAPRLVEPIAEVVARPAAAPTQTDPPIHMARVRPVAVVAAPTPAATPDRAEPYLERAPAAYTPPWYRRPATVTPPAFATPARRVMPRHYYAPPDTGRGARPSTLTAQARRIEQGEPAIYAANHRAQPSYAAGQMPSSPAEAQPIRRGDYAVQVGAFATAAEAEQRLREVRDTAERVLAAAADHTEPVTQGARTLYRARFADFEAASAAQACNALRRQQVDCFVTRIH